MRTFFTLLALLTATLAVLAQSPNPTPFKRDEAKSVKPIKSLLEAGKGDTTYAEASAVKRAVVIGISDYQDPAIPDLRFADKDAEAFAQWLRSPAGGSLDQGHLQLLTNEQASSGRIVGAFDWLMDESKEGDQAIIYFSGHGDVESKTAFQLGFLLLWNSPGQSYMAGAYPVIFLQSVVTTLSTKNKAKVLLITDACHAGKLAGSQIGGPQITGAILAKQFANEVKILSCQPNEYSLEGEQWGGGRGVFSYHFVDALYGMADQNTDTFVSLSEVDRYLEDHVTAEAAPQSQIPLVVGNKAECLATVNPGILADLRKFKAGELPQFTPVEQRFLEAEVLSAADSGARDLYDQFGLAVREKRFLEPAGNCADDFYQQMMALEAIAPLRGLLKRNYAAVLQDDAQQAVNAILKINIQAVTKSEIEKAHQYHNFPKLLSRAAELLGTEHYMYSTLKARQLLFEGLILLFETFASREPESGRKVLDKCYQSLHYQSDAAITHLYMSICFAVKMNQPDSAIVHARIATQLAETWVYPYAYLAYNLSRFYQRYDDAKAALDKAMAIDSNSVAVWTGLGAVYHYQRQFQEAARAYRYALRLDSANALAWANLGVELVQTDQYDEAEAALQQALQLNPNQVFARYVLGCMYIVLKQPKAAEDIFLQALQINPGHIGSRDSLAHLYLAQNRLKEAEIQLLEITRYNSAYPSAWYTLACLAALDGRHDQALEFLEKALGKGGEDFDSIENDVRLDAVRPSEGYQSLMKKYFPEESKK